MSEGHSPEAVHVPLLVGEASGRVEVPLAGLPEGIGAFTIPRKGPDGDRVPRDRRGRTRVREADLVGERPVEAFLPPAGLSTAELAWVLETGSSRRWQTIKGKFGDRAWPVSLDLIRAGGVVMRCDVSDPRTYQPRSWRLTHAWAAQAADLLREMRGQPVPCVARYYSPGLLLTGWAVAGARGAGLTEGDGHLTIMVCETSEQRGGRRGHRR